MYFDRGQVFDVGYRFRVIFISIRFRNQLKIANTLILAAVTITEIRIPRFPANRSSLKFRLRLYVRIMRLQNNREHNENTFCFCRQSISD